MHKILILLCLSLLSTNVLAETTYRIGIYPSAEKANPNLKTMTEEAWSLAGHKLEWVELTAELSLRYAIEGEIDGDVLRVSFAAEDFKNLVPIPVPVKLAEYWVYVLDSKPCFKLSEISQRKPVGSIGFRYFEEVYDLSDVGYEITQNPTTALKMLASNRADYTVGPINGGKLFLSLSGVKTKTCGSQPIFSIPTFTFIHKHHSALLPSLTRAYKQTFGYSEWRFEE